MEQIPELPISPVHRVKSMQHSFVHYTSVALRNANGQKKPCVITAIAQCVRTVVSDTFHRVGNWDCIRIFSVFRWKNIGGYLRRQKGISLVSFFAQVRKSGVPGRNLLFRTGQFLLPFCFSFSGNANHMELGAKDKSPRFLSREVQAVLSWNKKTDSDTKIGDTSELR